MNEFMAVSRRMSTESGTSVVKRTESILYCSRADERLLRCIYHWPSRVSVLEV